jgi:YbbR domain-containing protein
MSQRVRLGALRTIAIALAILLWLFVTLERRGERPAEKVVEATVTYNPPPGMMILDPQGQVRVRLRGSDRAIRRINPFQVDVQVIVPASHEGAVEVSLHPENVMMPEGLEVVSIEPNRLKLHVDQVVRRLLPVEVPLVGEPAAGAALGGPPQPTPDEVLVSGPSKLVGALRSVRTNPISLDSHAFDFTESTLLISPDPLLQLQTQVVSVSVPMQQPQPVGDKGAGAAKGKSRGPAAKPHG